MAAGDIHRKTDWGAAQIAEALAERLDEMLR